MFIVMTASAKVSGKLRQYGGQYRHVAVVEVDPSVCDFPAMISTRAKGVVRIVSDSGALKVGTTERCAWFRAVSEANALATKLNSNVPA